MANYLCTLRGTLAAGTVGEIFSHSLPIQSTTDQAGVASALVTAWNGVWAQAGGQIANLFHPSVTYTEATCAGIMDLTGTDPAKPWPKLMKANHASFAPPLAGTALTNALPSQNSIAVSTTGGTYPNGTPIKGRFYLPGLATGALQATDGLITLATQNELADAMDMFIRTLASSGHTACVWSRGIKADPLYSSFAPMLTIRVGNRVDTIRRRRNKMPEVYVERSVLT